MPYVEDFNGVQHEYGDMSLNSLSSVGQLPSRYQELIDANPYRNLNYRKSFWQSVAEGLGFRTSYDDRVEDAQLNARETDFRIALMNMQDQFNSPTEMSSRMRDAGLNPDLQGIGDVAQASSPAEDLNNMNPQDSSQSFQRAMSTVGQIAQFAYGAIESTFAILKDSKALKNMKLVNDGLAIQNENNVISGGNSLSALMSDIVWKTTSPDKVPDPKTLSGSLERALSGIFTDKGMYERASKVAQEFAAGLPQDVAAWKTWYERASSKSGYASYAGSEGYDEDMSEAMLSFYGFIRDMQNNAEIALRSLDISNSEEQIEFNVAHDSTLEGTTANATYDANTQIALQKAQEARITKAINDSFDRWTSALEKKANSGERGAMWASIALGLIGLVRLTAMSGMSFSFGSSRGQYHGDSSSSRFGFGF